MAAQRYMQNTAFFNLLFEDGKTMQEIVDTLGAELYGMLRGSQKPADAGE